MAVQCMRRRRSVEASRSALACISLSPGCQRAYALASNVFAKVMVSTEIALSFFFEDANYKTCTYPYRDIDSTSHAIWTGFSYVLSVLFSLYNVLSAWVWRASTKEEEAERKRVAAEASKLTILTEQQSTAKNWKPVPENTMSACFAYLFQGTLALCFIVGAFGPLAGLHLKFPDSRFATTLGGAAWLGQFLLYMRKNWSLFSLLPVNLQYVRERFNEPGGFWGDLGTLGYSRSQRLFLFLRIMGGMTIRAVRFFKMANVVLTLTGMSETLTPGFAAFAGFLGALMHLGTAAVGDYMAMRKEALCRRHKVPLEQNDYATFLKIFVGLAVFSIVVSTPSMAVNLSGDVPEDKLMNVYQWGLWTLGLLCGAGKSMSEYKTFLPKAAKGWAAFKSDMSYVFCCACRQNQGKRPAELFPVLEGDALRVDQTVLVPVGLFVASAVPPYEAPPVTPTPPPGDTPPPTSSRPPSRSSRPPSRAGATASPFAAAVVFGGGTGPVHRPRPVRHSGDVLPDSKPVPSSTLDSGFTSIALPVAADGSPSPV